MAREVKARFSHGKIEPLEELDLEEEAGIELIGSGLDRHGKPMSGRLYYFSFEGEELLKKITPRKRVDLFFFYKECLTNIMRHSGATRASTRLSLTPGKLSLSVNDNGSGMPCALPGSLKRRARLLGAKLSMVKPAGGGTCITLQLKLRKTRLFI